MNLKRKAKVVFVELQLTLPNLASLLICPCYGIVLLATMLRDLGYATTVLVEGITKVSVEKLDEFDVICFTVKSGSANKTYQWADQLRHNGKTVIFGGTHATYFPEDCLAHCDYVVRGEGDDALPALLSCLEHESDFGQIRGVSYLNKGDIKNNDNVIPPTDLSISADYFLVRDISLWTPLRSLLRRRRVMLPVQSSRGCPKNCSFCVVSKMFGSGYRKRPIGAVISELESALTYTRNIQFIDNDFVGTSGSDVEHTGALLEAIISNKLEFDASAFVKLDIYKERRLLKLIRKAGINTLLIGFESINARTLDGYNKHQEANEMIHAVNVIKEHGFDIAGTFMAGSDEDNYESIIETARLGIQLNVDQLHYFMLTVYPDMKDVIPPERVFVDNWDSFHGYYATLLPKNISPSKLHEAVFEANHIFYSFNRIMKSLLRFKFAFAGKLVILRILYQMIERSIKEKHIPLLQELERELYINGELDEDSLRRRHIPRIKYWDNAINH